MVEINKKVWSEILKGRDHLGDLARDGMIILRWIFKELGCGVDYVCLAVDGDLLGAHVNMIIIITEESALWN